MISPNEKLSAGNSENERLPGKGIEAAETDESRGDDCEIPRQQPERSTGRILFDQFGELAKWLTNSLAPPKRKSRRTEDTTGGFRLSALKTTRPDKAKIIYSRIVDHVVPAAWDLLDWLRMWEPAQHESDVPSSDDNHVEIDGEQQDLVTPESYQQFSGLFLHL